MNLEVQTNFLSKNVIFYTDVKRLWIHSVAEAHSLANRECGPKSQAAEKAGVTIAHSASVCHIGRCSGHAAPTHKVCPSRVSKDLLQVALDIHRGAHSL